MIFFLRAEQEYNSHELQWSFASHRTVTLQKYHFYFPFPIRRPLLLSTHIVFLLIHKITQLVLHFVSLKQDRTIKRTIHLIDIKFSRVLKYALIEAYRIYYTLLNDNPKKYLENVPCVSFRLMHFFRGRTESIIERVFSMINFITLLDRDDSR